MKKHTRIGLMVLAIAILLLALTIPALAKKDEPYQCYIQAVTVNHSGIFGSTEFYGDLVAVWENPNLLTNTCTGNIPFGDNTSKGKGWWYADFDDTCEYWGEHVICEDTYLYTDQDIWPLLEIVIYDPDTGELLPADTYSLTIFDDGEFVFYKTYTP